MMRYFDLIAKVEAIPVKHFDPSEIPLHVVAIADDNVFFQPLPIGWQVTYDNDGTPVGREVIPAPSLDDLKKNKLRLINSSADAELNLILSTYPESEIVSWDKQEAEARAYLINSDAATPLLSAIATARGMQLPVLVGKVIEKADIFATLSGAVFGKRQRLETKILDTKTEEELEAISW